MRTAGDRPDGHRLRALIVLLWRAGLRISEALALPGAAEHPGDRVFEALVVVGDSEPHADSTSPMSSPITSLTPVSCTA